MSEVHRTYELALEKRAISAGAFMRAYTGRITRAIPKRFKGTIGEAIGKRTKHEKAKRGATKLLAQQVTGQKRRGAIRLSRELRKIFPKGEMSIKDFTRAMDDEAVRGLLGR